MEPSERSRRVLAALVREYISSGEPVASSLLVRAAGRRKQFRFPGRSFASAGKNRALALEFQENGQRRKGVHADGALFFRAALRPIGIGV